MKLMGCFSLTSKKLNVSDDLLIRASVSVNEMYCHDLEVTSSNSCQFGRWMRSTSVLSFTLTKMFLVVKLNGTAVF